MSTETGTAALRAIYEPLTDSVRRLIDISIRTEASALTVAAAKDKIDSAITELSTSLTAESFGVRQDDDGQSMAWGNVLIGVRNPVAPPLSPFLLDKHFFRKHGPGAYYGQGPAAEAGSK